MEKSGKRTMCLMLSLAPLKPRLSLSLFSLCVTGSFWLTIAKTGGVVGDDFNDSLTNVDSFTYSCFVRASRVLCLYFVNMCNFIFVSDPKTSVNRAFASPRTQ